jgi:hypothetical protein
MCGFLSDEEVHTVWNIMENALDRAGWVGVDGELSIRIYDDNLKQNIDSSTSYDPEPFETDHPFFYDY